MIYGYDRVSTGGQSVAAQVGQLKAAGGEKVFRGVASGGDAGEATRENARRFNVSHSPISRLTA
jgi:DNA invertase Pin-like site-specific DNA recombinase